MLSQADTSLIVSNIALAPEGASSDTPVPPFPCSRQNASHSMVAALRGEQQANLPAASRFASYKQLCTATGIVVPCPD